MDVTVVSLAERPELLAPAWGVRDSWPEFVRHDPVGGCHFGQLLDTFPEHVHVALDEAGEVVARAIAVPFALRGEGDEDGSLPGRGWDEVLARAFRGRRLGVPPDTVSAIEVVVVPERQGTGLSSVMLAAMREGAAARGFSEVVAPVRPNAKHLEPRTPMAEYAYRTRDDGLPHDPWLRVHVRAGGVIDGVAPASMVVPGTLAQWRRWTGLPFAEEGWVEVPGALSPVRCEPAHDHAVYVEPNVWVRHAIS